MFGEIDQLISNRESPYPENLLLAREKLEALPGQAAGPVSIRLAEVLFWLGEYAEDSAEKEKYFSAGVEAGKKAVELEAENVAAHLWYAACMGSHGVVRGIMSSLFYLGPVEKHGKKAMELDENYYEGGPLRLMGRLYQQAPGWPVGPGDGKKAIELLEKAVKVGPDVLYNHVYLAEAYLAKSRKGDASRMIEDVLSRVDGLKYQRQAAMIKKDALALKARL